MELHFFLIDTLYIILNIVLCTWLVSLPKIQIYTSMLSSHLPNGLENHFYLYFLRDGHFGFVQNFYGVLSSLTE